MSTLIRYLLLVFIPAIVSDAVGQAYNVTLIDCCTEYEYEDAIEIIMDDDEVSGPLPIGFDFDFFGDTYDEFYLSSNGFITFDDDYDDGCCEGGFIPDPATPNNLIALAWDDLNLDYDGYYSYETVGTPGDRRLIVSMYVGNCEGYYLDGQIWLYEGSNNIELHLWEYYGLDCYGTTQGIENASGTDAYYPDGRNADFWEGYYEVITFEPTGGGLFEDDAGILGNQVNYCEGSQQIFTAVRNYGTNDIDSVTVNWEWDGIPQSPIDYSFTIPPGTNAGVFLGAQTLTFGQSYNLKVWTSQPNGNSDPFPANDTVTSNVTVGMGGEYTIGGTSPDYANFGAAINAMTTHGICDSVVFKVRNGTYNEQVVLPSIFGSYSDHWIVFESESGDSTSVVLTYNSTNTDSNYVLKIDGANQVCFRNITIEAEASDLGRVLHLASSENLKFENCVMRGYGPTTTNLYTNIFAYGVNKELSFRNCRIVRGSWGMYSYTDDNFDYTGGLLIENCVIDSFLHRGLFIARTNAPVITGNSIFCGSSEAFGVILWQIDSNLIFANNSIRLEEGTDALLVEDSHGLPGSVAPSIYNNFVSTGSVSDRGIRLFQCSDLGVYFNSINHFGNDPNGGALELFSSTNITSKNNNLSNRNGGYAFRSNSSTIQSDYNNYYDESNALVWESSVVYTTLEDWQDYSNGDSNSLSVPPFFTDSTDLHTIQPFLNLAGVTVMGIGSDFDGEARNATSPDIGADEFTPLPNDCQVAALISPTVSCNGTQDVVVALRNLGSNAINSVDIGWTLNGVAQSTVNTTRMIDPAGGADTIHVSLGSLPLLPDSLYRFEIWTSMPNSVPDVLPENDTLSKNYNLPLDGSYTIGGSNPDFATIQEAIDILVENGVCDSVAMLIRNGVYNTNLVIRDIPGAGAMSPVLFTSESGDTSNVTIVSDDIGGTIDAVVLIDGAGYIAFENITFIADEFFDLNVFTLKGSTRSIKLEGNALYGSTSDGSAAEIILATGSDTTLTIRNNYFNRGSDAIRISGISASNRTHDLMIVNNVFKYQVTTGIYVRYVNSLEISGNDLTRDIFTGTYYGLWIEYDVNDFEVFNNTINNFTPGTGIYMREISDPLDTLAGRVFNNFVAVSANDAVFLSNCRDIDFVFNNVNNVSSTFFHRALRTSGTDSFRIYNNILAANGGTAITLSTSSNDVKSDYNCLYSQADIGNYGINTATLADWQTATGLDQNSVSVEPMFNSWIDLHIFNSTLNALAVPIAGIETDIDGDQRDATTPDIGADEIGTTMDNLSAMMILPEIPFARGNQDIEIVVRNLGNNAVTSFAVDWEFRDTAQSQFNYSGSIPPLSEDTITIGSKYFDYNIAHSIKAWTVLPNGVADAQPVNDTAYADSLYAGVGGTLTIGGSNPDFDSIGQAVDAMKFGQVLDSTNFLIRNGVYREEIVIEEFAGMSCETPVIFTSESGDWNLVTWSDSALAGPPLTISGADGLIFNDLTIKGFNSSAVVISDSAHCNIFDNCRLWGVETTSTSAGFSTILSSNGYDTANVFMNNLVLAGSYGVRWFSNASNSYEPGTKFIGNTFKDQYHRGVYLIRQSGLEFKDNLYQSSITTSNSFTALEVQFATDACVIDANDFQLLGTKGTAIYIYASTGSLNSTHLISNNFISIGEASIAASGIWIYSCNYIDIVNNSVHVGGPNGNSAGIYASYCSDIKVLNNIFYNEAGGAAIWPLAPSYFSECDHNDLYTTGALLARTNAQNYTDLASWQATGLDLNSVTVDPQYVAINDLHAQNAVLDGAGLVLPYVELDFDGELRDPVTPDIGADEFSLFVDDVGLVAINYPTQPFPSGDNTVFIKFTNNGADTLVSMQVDWEVDGILQPSYAWAGLLGSGETYDSLDIGTYNFTPFQDHTLKVWVSTPNGEQDGLASNDTLEATGLYPGLSGIYTIGGVDPDFETITDAVAELDSGGAAGPVLFNIRDGIYAETPVITEYPGSNCDASVTFQSESMDSSSVTITNLGIDAHTLTIDAADGLTFQYLTIESVNPAYRRVIEYYGGADCNTYRNNHLKGYESTSTSNTYSVVYSNSDSDLNNIFENNLITDGAYSFYLRGVQGVLSGTVIRNNILKDPYGRGISALYESGIRVEDNYIYNEPTSGFQGINLNTCDSALVVTGNQIIGENGFAGIYITGGSASETARTLIANNFVALGGSSNTNPLLVANYDYIDIVYNSAHNYSTRTQTFSNVVLSLSSVTSASLLNNVFLNSSPGGPVMTISSTTMLSSDHNCLHNQSASSYIIYDDADYLDLAGWQSFSGLDMNSVDSDPQFATNTDLHAMLVLLNGGATPIAGVDVDIDGETRDMISPDIGADEFVPAASDDAGVMGFLGPFAPFASGPQPVTVTLKNFGGNPLTSASIRWLMNGLEQAEYIWNGNLAPGECDTLVLDTFNFAPVIGYDFLAWTEDPNGVPDSTNVNDTLALPDIYAALDGSYTLGGSLPDFNLISQFETALDLGGMIDDVEILIRPGFYDQQLRIGDFPRVSPNDSIVIRSENGVAGDVEITRTSGGNGHTVQLDGAFNIVFKGVSITSSYGKPLDISNGSHNILIDSCRFRARIGGSGSNQSCIASPATVEDNIAILNSRFTGGTYGVYLSGGNGLPERGLRIENCEFIGQYNGAIRLNWMRGMHISANEFRDSTRTITAIICYNVDSTFSISANDIRYSLGGRGLYLEDCKPQGAFRGAVVNNFIGIQGGSNPAIGSFASYVENMDYYYNTVRIENAHPESVPFVVDGLSLANIKVRNCIFANLSGNYAIDVDWNPNFTNNTMDHCNLYSVEGPLARWFVDYPDLLELQIETGDNLNSLSFDPIFIGVNGYELAQAGINNQGVALTGITTDIAGANRDPAEPDIGAYEYTPLPADLAVTELAAPSTYCGLDNDESVTVVIQNRGADPQNNFNVGYRMGNGSWIIENVALTIQPGQVLQHTFISAEDLSTPGIYMFEALVSLAGDQDTSSDTLTNIEIEHIPALVASPSNLVPRNDSINLNKPVSLSWSPTVNATLYDVYIWREGDPIPAEPQVAGITQINQSYNQLDYGEQYNWFVAARNTCDQTTYSDTISFRVRNLPDLVVDTVIAPILAFSGQDIEVEWITRNIGTGSTQSTLWTDAVYLSSDATLNTSFDTYLGGVQNLTALDSNGSYSQSFEVTLPIDVVGNYYLIVNTDRFNGLIESNNNNNWERSQVVIAIQLTPPPDLVVTDVVVPTLSFSGDTISVQYTIKNQGSGSTGIETWYNRIMLSPDPFNPVGNQLALLPFTGELLPDSSVTEVIQVTLPQGISGIYFVFGVADSQNDIFEFGADGNNATSSDTLTVLLAPTADLVVDTVFLPDTVSSDELLTVSWQVINEGGGPTLSNYWRDEVYLSPAPVFNSNFNVLVGNAYQYNPVASLDTYSLSINRRIPKLNEGPYYLFAYTDKTDNEYEFDKEDNNIYRRVEQVMVLNPDITADSLNCPDTVTAANEFTLEYELLNIGNGSFIDKAISNRIYASHSGIYDESAVYIMQYSSSRTMASGDTLPESVNLQLPASLSGDVYLHISLDYNDRLFEGSEDLNNIVSMPIPLFLFEGPIPDLEVGGITHPDTILAGDPFNLAYNTVNVGFGPAEGPWEERLFISFDSMWNEENAILLRSNDLNIDLDAGDTVSTNELIELDADFVENAYYFYIQLDAEEGIYEGIGESDNIFRSNAVYVLGAPNVDIALDTIVFDTTNLESGGTYPVSWSASIVNGAMPVVDAWSDAFYLSADQQLDTTTDLRVASFITDGNETGFGPGNPLTTMDMIEIPDGLSGQFYLIANADYRNYHSDTNRVNNVNLLRNASGDPLLFNIDLAEYPDLVIDNFIAPDDILSGQPVQLQLTVTNTGPGIASGQWRDRIYLSVDNSINVGDLLLVDQERTYLGPGQTISDTFDVTIPVTYTGNYLLIADTDQGKSIYEFNNEGNNQAIRQAELTLPPPSDLQVRTIVVPLEGVAGDLATVSWETENVGSFPAQGNFREVVYLSLDTMWDVSDALMGFIDQFGYIPPSGAKESNITAPLTNVLNEEYYAIVQTDALDNFAESDESNNYSSSVTPIDIDIKTLFIDSLTADTLFDLQELYYKIEVTPELEGETMIISLDGDSLNGLNELYVSHGNIPSRAEFDFTYDKPFSGQQRVIIPSLEVGTYFLLGYGSSMSTNYQEVELLARIVPFEIESVSPLQGVTNTRVTVAIRGIKLGNTAMFRLRQNEPWFELVADTVFAFSDNLVYATFDLANVPVDTYSLDLIKADSSLAYVDNFMVIPDGKPDIQYNVNAPSATPNRSVPIKIVITYQNVGEVDAEDPSITIGAPYGNGIAATLQELRAGNHEPTITVPLTEANGPPNVLRPGGAGVIEVFAWSNPAPSFVIGITD